MATESESTTSQAIHLDTSFLIRALVADSDESRNLRRWLEGGRELAISSIAWAELLAGPLTDQERELAELLVTQRLPLVEQHAELAAELYNRAGRKRGLFRDCLIAATAIRHEAALATSNPKDFERLGVPLAT